VLLSLSVRYANQPWSRSLALIGELGLLPDGATGDFALDPWGKSGQSPSFVGCAFSGADPTVAAGNFAQPEDLWEGKGGQSPSFMGCPFCGADSPWVVHSKTPLQLGVTRALALYHSAGMGIY